ncbi:hypothetical protein PpBr36_04210 [Pyricularia pennisetigena]|uniref:hypothetical protein n=1 Tax=Pyricularia pennisetigena TaxID=1578925 RepID=UPI001153E541|nr:hypothetical protein PpBr36_04210 [Pyricularia pennisetigena]TLS27357.1 hypothetical protein PpBr36_04210 [Pyricularia pennisetigena]
MRIQEVVATLPLLGVAMGVQMTRYDPASNVEPAFGNYLRELYATAEDPKATDSFTNFFTPQGKLTVLGHVATGPAAIVRLKEQLLPPAGYKQWNHLPNVTTVYSQTPNYKVYDVLGVIETRFNGGRCTKAYYSTRFTVTKDASGAPQLRPHARNLVHYDDYIVDPPESPTHIPC